MDIHRQNVDIHERGLFDWIDKSVEYCAHQTSGEQAHPPLHGMGLALVAATINGVKRFYLLNHLSNL